MPSGGPGSRRGPRMGRERARREGGRTDRPRRDHVRRDQAPSGLGRRGHRTQLPVRPIACGPAWPGLTPYGAVGAPDPLKSGRLAATRLAQEIRGLLDELGPTPGAMAASLERAGVRGYPAEPDGSPVARYLSPFVGADPIVKAPRVE